MTSVNIMEQLNETRLLEEFRARLLSKDRKLSLRHESKVRDNDKFLERYLVKYDKDLDKAEKSIEKYMRRHDEISAVTQPESKYTKEVLDLVQAYFTGTDNENRLVSVIPKVGDFKTFLSRANEETVQLLFSCIVKSAIAAEKILDDQKLDSVVVLLDIGKVPYSQYLHRKSVEFLLLLMKTVVRHLPAITPKIIIVNAPWHFKSFLNFVLSLVKIPADIVVFSSSESNWREKLRKEHIPANALSPEYGGTQINPKHVGTLRASIL